MTNSGIVESGAFYIVQTQLPKGLFLRTAIMNPFTAQEHLAKLLETVREEARSLEV